MNNVLLRLPLAGYRVLEYDSGKRGQIAKTISIISRLALLALGGLILANVASPLYLGLGAMGVSVLAFTSYTAGGSQKRGIQSLFFEFMITSACIFLSVIGGVGYLTSLQYGIELLSVVAGGGIIANCFEKSSIAQLTAIPKPSSLPLRIMDKAIALGRDLTVGSETLLSYVTHRKNYSSTIENNPESRALGVMLTGLRGPPSVFDKYYDSLLKGHNITLFQPSIPKMGNCSLEEAVKDIYGQVANWAKANPKKPIVLIGVSNGARMSAYISSRLKNEDKSQNPIHVSCIAGPFKGTKFINHPDLPRALQTVWSKIFKLLFDKNVYEELSWESPCAQKIVEGMKSAATAGVHYDFYSTSSDTQITPYTSAFPLDIKGARYFSTFAEGHISIVRVVQEHVLESSLAAISQSLDGSLLS